VILDNSNLIFRSLNELRKNPKVYARWNDGLNDKSIGFEFDYYTNSDMNTDTFARINILGNGFVEDESL